MSRLSPLPEMYIKTLLSKLKQGLLDSARVRARHSQLKMCNVSTGSSFYREVFSLARELIPLAK